MAYFKQEEAIPPEESVDVSFASRHHDEDDATMALFLRPRFSDCVVKCGDKTWQCHRAILGSRCSFFSKIFSGPYQESTSCVVELHEDDPAAVHNMLIFLYGRPDMEDVFHDLWQTREIPEWITNMAETLTVADKYNVIELVQACVSGLQNALFVCMQGPNVYERDFLALACVVEHVYRSEAPLVFKAIESDVVESMCNVYKGDKEFRERVLDLMQHRERLWRDVLKATLTIGVNDDRE